MKNEGIILKRFLACMMIVVMTLTAAPMSGFVGLRLPQWSEMFATKANAATEYTSGYYTYTVTDEKATITDCDTAVRGEVTIPSTLDGYPVTRIGDKAFYECRNLTGIIIPEGVTSIGSYAFSVCTNLTSITIPSSVTSIGIYAFLECARLNRINVNSDNISYTSLNGVLFNEEETELICYPAGAATTSYTIPDGVTRITEYALYQCINLIYITIPDSMTNIGYDAFSGCTGLKNITIPSNVTSIGNYAFLGCTSLRSIDVNSANASYASLNGVLFNKAKTKLICYPAGAEETSYSIPSSVTNITDYAFYACEYLTNISIPVGVTSLGGSAFCDCKSLTGITIPRSVTNIGSKAFFGCSSLSEITISNSKITVGSNAFDNTKYYDDMPLGSVYIGKIYYKYKGSIDNGMHIIIDDGTECIADSAFKNQSELTRITIPYSISRIGSYAFSYCSNLKYAYYLGSSSDWDRVSVSKGMFDLGFSYSKLTNALIWHTSHSGTWNQINNPTCTQTGSKTRTCAECRTVETQSVPALGHIFSGAYSIDTPATCTSNGSKSRHCTRSGCTVRTNVTTIPAQGHSYSNACDTSCNVCGATRSIEHDYGSWSTVKAATCNRSGELQRTCSVCGNTETQIIPALTEHFVETDRVEATCAEDGYIAYECVNCGEMKFEPIPAYGHTMIKIEAKAATCAEEGTTAHYKCSVCNALFADEEGTAPITIEEVSLPAYGHQTIKIDAKEATCTEYGNYEYFECSACHVLFKDEAGNETATPEEVTIPATGHRIEKVEAKNGTCTENGNVEYWICPVCHSFFKDEEGSISVAAEEVIIPALGHSYSSKYTVDEEPYCTEPGSKSRHCVRCDAKTDVTPIPATGHVRESWPGYEPTCEQWGLSDGEYCLECGLTLCEPERIPPNGHNYYMFEPDEPTCTRTGCETYECMDCGKTKTETIPALGHKYSTAWTVDKQPTCTTAGSKSHHCTRCSAKKDVTAVAASGHKLKTTVTPATTTKNGKTVKICTVCKKQISSQTIYSVKTVSLSKKVYYCSGKNVTPSVTVKDSKGKTLKNGTDYTVTYPKSRKNPGTYSIKVTLKGNYTGSKTLKFKIQPGTVTGLKKINYKGYQLALQWNGVTKATGYEVQQYDAKKKKWVILGVNPGTRIGFKKMSGTNKWRIRAVITVGNKTYYGDYSKTLTTKS